VSGALQPSLSRTGRGGPLAPSLVVVYEIALTVVARTGIRTSVSTSARPTAVWYGPRWKSSIETTRSPALRAAWQPRPASPRSYPHLVASRTRAATYARRRQRRMARVTHDLTDEQWLALMEAWGGCAYCGGDGAALQKDCMLPISRGGRYTLANVVPACGSCNASKCNTEVTTWLRRKRMDEAAFLVRQAEIAHLVSADPERWSR